MKADPCLPRIIALAILAVIVLLAFTGCVSARYKMVDKNPASPGRLNLTANRPPVEASVLSVVVCHGPGSWKRDAYWDEYMVSIVNRGDTPLTIETASLTDFRGDTTAPGDNPWLLEKQSLTRRDELNRKTKAVLVQLGGGYLAAGGSGAIFVSGGLVRAAAGSAIGLAAFPAYIGGTIYRNISSRHDIEKEFQRRRLVLPQTLAPGQTVQSSFFFRISPAPQQLVLHGRAR